MVADKRQDAKNAKNAKRKVSDLGVLGVLGSLALCLGCDYLGFNSEEFSGDPFPILVDDSSGALIVGIQEAGDDAKRIGVIDVMSPITLVDRGADIPPRIGTTNLTVLGARVLGGELDLPRARFRDHEVFTLHPCQSPECQVGTGIGPRPFNALIGLDAFASDALRLRVADDQIYILPDIAGSEIHRSRSCDAVFASPFRGGGTLLVGGTERSFTNWRIAIDVCLAPRPAHVLPQSGRGVDALLVFSSAVGPTLLSASAYQRYVDLTNAPAIESLPEHTVFLPSGPVSGYLTDIPSIALVGNSTSNPRAPCRQMWASHFLASRDCTAAETDRECENVLDDNGNGHVNDGCPGLVLPETLAQCANDIDDDGDGFANDGCPADDCPCTGETFCAVPALIELAPPGRIPVLVVADGEPTLQALRTELRPDRPEVDGILGTEALEAVELDIDYAHNRLLGRCVDRAACGARAALSDRDARAFVNGCLDVEPGPIVFED